MAKIKVKASEEFKRLNVKPKELDHVPAVNEIFELSEARYEVLSGKNDKKIVYVTKVEENNDDSEEKVAKKTETTKNTYSEKLKNRKNK